MQLKALVLLHPDESLECESQKTTWTTKMVLTAFVAHMWFTRSRNIKMLSHATSPS